MLVRAACLNSYPASKQPLQTHTGFFKSAQGTVTQQVRHCTMPTAQDACHCVGWVCG